MNISDAVIYINDLTLNNIPHIFVFDYALTQAYVWKTDEIPHDVLVSFPSFSNTDCNKQISQPQLTFTPIPLDTYYSSFEIVQYHLQRGNSFLVNLTAETPIHTKSSLPDIFYASSAPFKLCIDNEFIVFSPEPFISISNNCIQTFPMKGTIDARIEDAHEKILNNNKEMAEHATIVDLLRNDMSMIAQNVRVRKYRYTETIQTTNYPLIQVSSCIEGTIIPELQKKYGSILYSMLPAGSICGAPKPKTLEIIKEAETHDRGFYTGVMGFSNGHKLESAVMIRFIQQKKSKLYYKSGGGITTQSNKNDEYNELIQKIYVPTH